MRGKRYKFCKWGKDHSGEQKTRYSFETNKIPFVHEHAAFKVNGVCFGCGGWCVTILPMSIAANAFLGRPKYITHTHTHISLLDGSREILVPCHDGFLRHILSLYSLVNVDDLAKRLLLPTQMNPKILDKKTLSKCLLECRYLTAILAMMCRHT